MWAFTVLKSSWQKKPLYHFTFAFLCALIIQSFFEIYGYIFSYTNNVQAAYYGMKGYYAASFISICLLPFLILQLTRKQLQKNYYIAALLLYFTILILLIFSNWLIKDIKLLGITFTVVKGNYYWLFQASVVSTIAFAIYQLKSKVKDNFLQIRTNNILITFIPVAFFAIFIILLMQLGVQINAIGFMPICTSIFVAGITNNICHKQIIDYRYWLPFSKKRREINKLIKPFIEIQADGLDPDFKKEYNQMIAKHALELFGGNQTKAAEWLKVSQSWVSRNNKHE